MESLTRLPGGAVIVFALAVAIASTAFVARSWQTRKAAASSEPMPVAPPG
jgi:predicted Kef-type K+ transport protein